MEADKTNKWLWFKLNAKISPAKSVTLYEALGSIDKIYSSTKPELEALGFLKADEIERLCNKSLDNIEEHRRRLDELEVFLLTYDRDDYPALLRTVPNPPLVLFARGKRLNLGKYLCIGVVGTRNPTVYGQRSTDMLASGIAANGAVIVSGMALGVDAISHRAALRSGMPTVAVLGCGVDVVVPKSNYALYEAILQNGMVISEYPISTPPAAYSFPQRNRIIAGISHGILVTEADVKSGSLITADYALRYGRDIFALPGSIDSDASKGTNRLIKQGAFPVTEPSDVTACFYSSNLEQIKNTLNDFVLDAENNSVESEPEPEDEKIEIPQNAPDEEKIMLSLSRKPLTIDQISYATGIALGSLDVMLLMMEVGGKIRKTQGIYYTTA